MSPKFRLFVVASFLSASSLVRGDEPATDLKPGAVVLDERLGTAAAEGKWLPSPWSKIVAEGPNSSPCLRLDVPKNAAGQDGGFVEKDVNGVPIKLKAGNFEASRPLDLNAIRGWRVKLIARVRVANVPVPEVPWEGIRLGIQIKSPVGDFGYNASGLKAKKDWFDVELSNVRIPDDATSASLYMGLISTAGTIWLQNVKLILIEPPLQVLAKNRPPFVSQTKWRGAGLGGGGVRGVIEMADKWHGNVGKWWISLPTPDSSQAEANSLLETQLKALDQGLAEGARKGVKIIIQLATYSPGNKWADPKAGSTYLYFLEKKSEDRVLAAWKMIATRYRNNSSVMGYDILNEPVLRVSPAADCDDWEGLAEKAALLINSIDPRATIFVQPEEWWGVNAFQKLRPIHAKNIVYSIHMYAPFEVTSQGIAERKSMGFSYPGMINGILWNKDTLREALRPAREFQMAYGVPMQVGEFSCIRWAPNDSEGRWLKDVTEIFEEYGWDWTYHAFNEWDGWNPELGSDPANSQILTVFPTAKKVLLDLMAKNQIVIEPTPNKD